jgi:hypothetical protein
LNEAAPAIFQALEGSAFAAGIRASSWAYMVANVGHVVALTVFAGAVTIMDVRMAGFLRATNPGDVLRNARIVALSAFLGLAATGFVLFAAEASHVILNGIFLFKLMLIALGLINVTLFEYFVAPRVRLTLANEPLPDAARISGIASLVIWIAVAICGRSIAYF